MVLIGLLKHGGKMLKIQNLIFENLSFRKIVMGYLRLFHRPSSTNYPTHTPLWPFGKSKFNLFEP